LLGHSDQSIKPFAKICAFNFSSHSCEVEGRNTWYPCCVLTFEPWLQMFSWALFSRDRTHIFNIKEVSTWTGKTHQRRRYTYCLILLSGSGNAAASCKRSSRACNTFCKCQCRRDIDPDPWVTSNQQSATHRFPMDSHQKQQAFFLKENSKLYWSILMFRHNSTVII